MDNSNNNNWGENSIIFSLNFQEYGYFRIPIFIRGTENNQSYERNLELVLRTDNLYLQGFIINVEPEGGHTGPIYNYYHFDFSLVRPEFVPRPPRIPNLTQIEGINFVVLTGISPDYRDMLSTENQNIYWNNIFNSFLTLTNDIDVNSERPLGNLASSLGRVILLTSEALRFRNIYVRIITHLVNTNEVNYIVLRRNEDNEIYRILVNWGSDSRGNYFQRALVAYGNNNRNLLFNTSIEDITIFLQNTSIQVILGAINFRLNQNNQNCKRQTRDLTNTYWHQKFCDLKQNIDKIESKINVFEILDKNTEGGNLKSGEMYVGTDNGVYFINNNGTVHKFNNLNFPINNIILDNKGSAYIINNKGAFYYLDLIGWGSTKLENIESLNLEKEIKLYYNNIQNPLHFELNNSVIRTHKVITFDLGPISSIDLFNKLEFLGNYYSEGWGARIKWGSWIYDPNNINVGKNSDIGTIMRENKNKFHNIIKTEQVDPELPSNEIEWRYTPLVIQDVNDYDGSARVYGKQKFGLTCYFKNENWYLQVIFFQYTDWKASGASLDTWLKIGNGIRLYND